MSILYDIDKKISIHGLRSTDDCIVAVSVVSEGIVEAVLTDLFPARISCICHYLLFILGVYDCRDQVSGNSVTGVVSMPSAEIDFTVLSLSIVNLCNKKPIYKLVGTEVYS